MPKVRNYLNRPVQKTKEFRKLSFETLENRELLAATPWNQATGIYGPPSLEQLTQFSETVVASSASASNLEASESSDDTLRFEILEETVYENPSSAANSVENAPSPNQLIFDENEPYYNEEEIIACVSSNAESFFNEDNSETFLLSSSGGSGGGMATLNIELGTSIHSSFTTEGSTSNYLLEGEGVGSGVGIQSIDDHDYLRVDLPGLPEGYSATVTFSGSAKCGTDYVILYQNWNSGYSSLTLSNNKYTIWGGSGGSQSLYLIPLDNSAVNIENKAVTVKLGNPVFNASGGATEYDINLGNSEASATIFDDDVEFLSDVDYVNGVLPVVGSDAIVSNVDSYESFVFYESDDVDFSDAQLTFLAGIRAVALNENIVAESNATLSGDENPGNATPAILYSITSGNESGYFSINSQTGELSLTDAFKNLICGNAPDAFSLTVQATYNGGAFTKTDVATVVVRKALVGFTPYTPETTYYDPMYIPKDKWLVNKVGIRRNTDHDAGETQPDSACSGSCSAEDDLIQVLINVSSYSGIVYDLQKSSANLKFWTSSDKAQEIAFSTDAPLTLTRTQIIWAEYASGNDDVYSLTLTARNSHTNAVVFQETVDFRPFTSITCAFVGEFETAGNPYTDPGINDWVKTQLRNGYDVHVWDDGYDFSGGIIDCYDNGEGRALDAIANAVNYQGVSSVALVGYSHGGGSVYNLAYRMYYDGQNGNLQKITNSYDLDFTSYIDAISNSSNANPLALDELPLGTQFHVNQYETNSRIDGCSIPESDVNIDRTGLDLEHSNDDPTISIDTNVLVQTTLTVYYLTHVER